MTKSVRRGHRNPARFTAEARPWVRDILRLISEATAFTLLSYIGSLEHLLAVARDRLRTLREDAEAQAAAEEEEDYYEGQGGP